MKTLAITIGLAVAVGACGGKNEGGDDQPAKDGDPGGEPGIPADAAELEACANPVSGTTVRLRKVADLMGSGVLVTGAPSDRRQFILEKRGVIRVMKDDVLRPQAFLDITARITTQGEQGLLGLAFHPSYAANGQFFIYYTTNQPGGMLRDVVARCTVSDADPNVANPTCTEILSIADFATNHNGGMIVFGADKLLYISTGDGGQAGDPQGTGQNLNSLLGKMLRIDVDNKDAGKEYGIPADNPFAQGGGAPEVFMYGLRNPWRWSFDRANGDMWLADVGQDQIEELNVLTPAQQKGANLGWSMYEGMNCFDPPCTAAGKFFPQFTRTHGQGWASITGGTVYRGTCYPDLVGRYFFTDYVRGGLLSATFDGTNINATELPGTFPGAVSGISADAAGEIYVTTAPNNGAGNGAVYHLEVAP